MKTQLSQGWTSEDGFQYKLTLESGATLEMLIFNLSEQRFIYEYTYRRTESRTLMLVNNMKLIVSYSNGLLKECVLSMNIIYPQKLGKKYFLGVDISPKAKIFAQFFYKRQSGNLVLEKIEITGLGNGTHIVDLKNNDEVQTKFVNDLFLKKKADFPVAFAISMHSESYFFLFRADNKTLKQIQVPLSIQREIKPIN